jgi:hypothetical protein
MTEVEFEEQNEGGLGQAFLSFVVGLLVPVVFESIVWGQGLVVFFLVLVPLMAALLYSESMLNVTSGVALGVGVVMMATGTMSWALAGLGTAASAFALARYAYADQVLTQLEMEDLEPHAMTD